MSTLRGKDGKITFVCDSVPLATKVFLAGDFNDWDPTVRRMVKGRDGAFRARLSLAPGEYQYKFLVDGEWLHDATAAGSIANEHGTLNSLVHI
jgi:1,4-alpha-glucan branching enzyme